MGRSLPHPMVGFFGAAAVSLGAVMLARGARQQASFASDAAGSMLVGDLQTESGSNAHAASNARSFADVNAKLGVCAKGQGLPPPCCCMPMDDEQACLSLGGGSGLGPSSFHPATRPSDSGASEARTCHPEGLCCRQPSPTKYQRGHGVCHNAALHVRVVRGENRARKARAYVKVAVGEQLQKTENTRGEWGEEFSFDTMGQIRVEVKWKKLLGAGSYGTFRVAPPPWQSTQVQTVDVPKFGALTLKVWRTTPWAGSVIREVDDVFDGSLCSAKGGAALLQRSSNAPGTLEDFLAELGALGEGGPGKPQISNEPVFLGILRQRPNQRDTGSRLMTRDYTLIIDRSGSMTSGDTVHVPRKMAEGMGKRPGNYTLTRWEQVSRVVQYLAPYVVAEDPDGVGVYFFDSRFDRADNVCDKDEVSELFRRNRPGGLTYLAEVLEYAMEPDTVGRAETIFVLTDGQATDPEAVVRAIISQTRKMCKSEMLSVSFIQVGTDSGASQYLDRLDNDLVKEGAKFDIVDTMTRDEMDGKSFLDVVELSVYD